MSRYSVHVRLGAHTWDIDQHAGTIDDADQVLAGLTFGWKMPTGLWPVQPGPMTCTLGVNVPMFVDYADLDQGQTCAVEVSMVLGGQPFVVGAFYGRITDVQAVPRPNRPGVTLSVAAVDYTVDTAELPDIAVGGLYDDQELLEYIWTTFFEGTIAERWTSPASSIVYGAGVVGIRAVIDLLLRQAVDVTDNTRLIIGPHVDEDGDLDFGMFTLDTISASALPADVDPNVFAIPASRLVRDVAWGRAKGLNPTLIVVKGWGGDNNNVVVAGPPTGVAAVRADLDVNVLDSGRAEEIAEFYVSSFDEWQIDDFTYLVTRAAEDEGYTDDDYPVLLPVDLFPRWRLAGGEDGRASCYSKIIQITGMEPTANPLHDPEDIGSADTFGVLTGAQLTIGGGHVVVDMSVRRTHLTEDPDPPDPPEPGFPAVAGWALAPYGSMALV